MLRIYLLELKLSGGVYIPLNRETSDFIASLACHKYDVVFSLGGKGKCYLSVCFTVGVGAHEQKKGTGY